MFSTHNPDKIMLGRVAVTTQPNSPTRAQSSKQNSSNPGKFNNNKFKFIKVRDAIDKELSILTITTQMQYPQPPKDKHFPNYMDYLTAYESYIRVCTIVDARNAEINNKNITTSTASDHKSVSEFIQRRIEKNKLRHAKRAIKNKLKVVSIPHINEDLKQQREKRDSFYASSLNSLENIKKSIDNSISGNNVENIKRHSEKDNTTKRGFIRKKPVTKKRGTRPKGEAGPRKAMQPRKELEDSWQKRKDEFYKGKTTALEAWKNKMGRDKFEKKPREALPTTSKIALSTVVEKEMPYKCKFRCVLINGKPALNCHKPCSKCQEHYKLSC